MSGLSRPASYASVATRLSVSLTFDVGLAGRIDAARYPEARESIGRLAQANRTTNRDSMTVTPGFDPYQILGVGVDADALVIQLAYKARIRAVHPDIAGAGGLDQTKRLNTARDWLLDPKRRAQLQDPASRRATARADAPTPGWGPRGRRDPTRMATYDPSGLDPFEFDFGPHTDDVRAFLKSILELSRDERARVNYSLGDTRPVFFSAYEDYLGLQLWSRARALQDAVSLMWQAGIDEAAPYVSPLGPVLPYGLHVTNAYAQWILQQDFLRRELRGGAFGSDHVIATFGARCTEPWHASVRQARYGPHQPRVAAFLQAATTMSVEPAERLARSWHRHMSRADRGEGSTSIGPGVWLPSPPNYPEVLKVSGFLAAVDASRIAPPEGLEEAHHDAFRYGLRLTGHVLALGLIDGSGPDYLKPWRDATGNDRTLWQRVRSR